MARSTRSTRSTEAEHETRSSRPEPIEVKIWDVERVRDTRSGIFFTLILNGVTINNCRLVQTRDRREFVSMPQYKGSDGKYYSVVFAPLPDEVETEVIEQVHRDLEKGRR